VTISRAFRSGSDPAGCLLRPRPDRPMPPARSAWILMLRTRLRAAGEGQTPQQRLHAVSRRRRRPRGRRSSRASRLDRFAGGEVFPETLVL